MRVFVSEYVCGGAWPNELLDGSLATEGRAMLLSLIGALMRIPEVDVVTTWDHRLGTFPLATSSRCKVVPISSPIDEQQAFERLCESADAAFVIAPEFHGILATRVETASSRTRLIGCDTGATTLCSDKLKLAEFLNAREIRTVPTERFNPASIETSVAAGESYFPCVVKPRDGAGSLLTFKVSNSDKLAVVSTQILTAGGDFKFIRQPFIEGVAVSCAAIVTAGQGGACNGPRIDVLPPCEQILSTDGCFRYEGAEFPIRFGNDSVRVEQIDRLVRRCCSVMPGLSGYVGFDLLIPHVENDEPIVIEINPRLTTGFLLWQKMCNDNLVARMLATTNDGAWLIAGPLSWKPAAAAIRMSSLAE